jgi:serine/threonine-protein kinase PpkA
MRFMPGGSLSDRLDHGPMNFTETAQIISRLAPALDAVHGQGIIHRDLKPGNILFDQYGNAFLSDFGIAHLTHATTTLTGEAVVGTPAYMSPEQVRGEDVDGRSDIYALGAILFEMLTGKQPYEATTPIAVALKQITEPVPRILEVNSDLPPECETLIRKAMAKDRERRFATAADFAAEHQAIIEKPRSEILPPPVEKEAAPTPAPPPSSQAVPPGSPAPRPVTPQPAPRQAQAAMPKPATAPVVRPPTAAPMPGVRAKAGVRRSRLPLWLSFGATI